MGRISQYPLDTDVQGNDKWIGTSVNNANATKNFSVDTVIEYLNKSGAVDSQALRYTYQNVQGDDVRLASTISFATSLGDNVPFAGITEWVISAFSKQIKDVRTYYDSPLIGKTILITNAFNPSNWAIFRWDSVTVDVLDANFYTIGLTHIESTGELAVGQDYLIALLDASSGGGGSAIWGDITGVLSAQTDLQSALNAKVPYTGATANVDLGEFELKAGQVEFDQTPTGANGIGVMRWNDSDGTVDLLLKGGNVTLQVGQEQVTRIVNKSGGDFLQANYQAVRINGAQGNRLRVTLALADSDVNSAETLGLVTETIANNQEGFVTSNGLIRDVNTTGSLQGETWIDGDVLYLSGTVLGSVTNIKPIAPVHTVIVGYVVRAHISVGQIYVKVDNGYELGELHNVRIPTPSDKDLLQYNSVNLLWENKSLSGAGVQPTLVSGTSIKTINGASLLGSGDIVISPGLKLLGGASMTSTLTAIVDATDTPSVLKISTVDVTNNGGSGIATNAAFGQSALTANTTGTFNTAIGRSALASNTTATDNVGIGYLALNLNSTGIGNVAVGSTALQTSLGNYNTAIGFSSLLNLSSGTSNVAIGTNALRNYGGSNNTAVGTSALNTCQTAGTGNTAIGWNSLTALTTGTNNTAVGSSSLGSNTTSSNNTAIGYESLSINTGAGNTALGNGSFRANTTGTNGVAIGNNALRQNISGINNVAVGSSALTALTTSSNNTAVGFEALKTSITNQNNTSVGSFALTLATSNDNTAIGYRSAVTLTTGSQNTFVGMQSGRDTLTGGSNVSVGFNALLGNSSGSGNVAIGYGAGWSGIVHNNVTLIGTNAGFNNNANSTTAIGNNALQSNTTGSLNTAVGFEALALCTTGGSNTSLGYRALKSITTGVHCTAVGSNALSVNTGNQNTALGYNAMSGNTTGASNIAIGWSPMQNSTTASNSVAIGYEALLSNNSDNNVGIGNEALRGKTTGGSNTAVGHTALRNTSTGSLNTAVGSAALSDNTTGASNVAMGWLTASGNFSGSVILGNQATSTANNQFVIGSTGYNAGSVVAEVNASANVWNVVINGVARKILLA